VSYSKLLAKNPKKPETEKSRSLANRQRFGNAPCPTEALGYTVAGQNGLNNFMNIQVAVLCDAATDDNGKLNLLGAFDTIYTPQLPAIHPQCSVALRITFFNGEEGKRDLRFNFVDADGKSIMPDFPPIPVEVTLPEEMHFGTRNFIVNIQQLKFDNPGLYSIDISFDGRSQASIPLMVKHNPPAVA